jgi:hypothetical protein
MSDSTKTATTRKTGVTVNAKLFTENPGTKQRLMQRTNLTSVGEVTLLGVKVSAFERTYESRGVERQVLELAIGREGTEELLKADIAVRAKQLAARGDNAAIGYFPSKDMNIVRAHYVELWESMNAIRLAWVAQNERRPRWDYKSTNGIEITFPEFEGAKYYISAENCKSHLTLTRRLTPEEYDQLEAYDASSTGGSVEMIVTEVPEF